MINWKLETYDKTNWKHTTLSLNKLKPYKQIKKSKRKSHNMRHSIIFNELLNLIMISSNQFLIQTKTTSTQSNQSNSAAEDCKEFTIDISIFNNQIEGRRR